MCLTKLYQDTIKNTAEEHSFQGLIYNSNDQMKFSYGWSRHSGVDDAATEGCGRNRVSQRPDESQWTLLLDSTNSRNTTM